MSGKFIDILYDLVSKLRWKPMVLLFLISFFGGWYATYYFEPKSDIIKPSVYWWYFVTNVLRSGSSGYTPETLGSRIVSLVSYFCGGIFFLAVLCKSTLISYELTQKKKKGTVKLKMNGHVVLLGYRAFETDSLIEQLKADHKRKEKIVLCSRHLEENPFPGRVDFIRGDTASEDVLTRSSVRTAEVIVISGHTDERAMAISIAVNSCNPNAHIVVYLESRENARIIKKLNPKIECVTSLRTMLIAQAIFNPGSTELIREIVSMSDPGTSFRLEIPSDVPEISFYDLSCLLHLHYRAIPIGYAASRAYDEKPVLNPEPSFKINGGMSLFYIAEYRIDGEVDWDTIRSAPAPEEFAASI